MFHTISKRQNDSYNEQLAQLQGYCERYPAIKEFVEYIVAYGNDDYEETIQATLGRDIIQAIWEISGIDLSSIGSTVHFDLAWVSKLNSFIGNYFLDDSAFDVIETRNGLFEFVAANDNGRWLQDPIHIINAVKSNRQYYKERTV